MKIILIIIGVGKAVVRYFFNKSDVFCCLIFPVVCTGQIKQLCPLDSQTCESEVLGSTYIHTTVCIHSFATQPPDIPFRSMAFDGTTYVDSYVNFSASTIDHNSVQGLFYFTQNTGVLLHYRAEQSNAEIILSNNYGKFQLYRKVTSGADATPSGGISISVDTRVTTYVIHPGIFFIENIIMAEILQPSDKIKLIFILF